MRAFLDFIFPPRPDEKAIRGLAPDALVALLALTSVDRTDPPTLALLPFSRPEVRSAVHEAKYHGSKHAFELLAHAVSSGLSAHAPDALIVPMPLGKRRFLERGFNQAEEVARRAGDALHIRGETSLLVRLRDTASQVPLSRKEREENMRDAFTTTRPAHADATYIVLDDVITTGATMQAAIDALRAGGAKRVLPVALAH